jgi:hypothetical protein
MQGFNLKIYDKSLKERAILRVQQFYRQNKWIEGVAEGENAIFLFEVSIKMIISNVPKKLKEKCRFRHLPQDYEPQFAFTIASS